MLTPFKYPAMFISMIFAALFASSVHGASINTSSISGIPNELAAKGFLIIRNVRIADGRVLSGQLLPGATSFVMGVPNEAGVLFVDWFEPTTDILLNGQSKLVAPGIPVRKAMKIELTAGDQIAETSAKEQAAPALPGPVAAPGATMNIGIPSDGISATGPGTHSRTGPGLAAMMITELSKAPCWGKSGGIEIIETEHIDAVRKEAQLCAGPYFDQTTCPNQNLVTPDHYVTGSVSSDGQTTQVTLNVTDSQGNMVSSETVSGSSYFDLVEEIGSKLGQKLCKGALEVTEANCLTAPASSYCDGGLFIIMQFKGTAHGAVGTIIRSNLGDNIGATLDCGGWTGSACGVNMRCCTRDNESQPEQISFVAQVNWPYAVYGDIPWCPVMGPFTIQLVAQVLNTDIEIDRFLTCPGGQ
jgi:hypothetical protein